MSDKRQDDTALHQLYTMNGKRSLVWRRADWNRFKRCIKKYGSQRLQAKLEALNIRIIPLDIERKSNDEWTG